MCGTSVCIQYFSYGGAGVHARVLHYDSSLSESARTQVSDIVTGNTSTGSESGVKLLLDLLKAPQRWELTQKRMINAYFSVKI